MKQRVIIFVVWVFLSVGVGFVLGEARIAYQFGGKVTGLRAEVDELHKMQHTNEDLAFRNGVLIGAGLYTANPQKYQTNSFRVLLKDAETDAHARNHDRHRPQ